MNSKKIDFLFYILPIFLIINLFMRWEFTNTMSVDSNSYIKLAEHLPNITKNIETYDDYIIKKVSDTSLFPLGYSIFLRLINVFFDDYIISYKVSGFICLLFSLIFVKIKNFYWREIWTLFTFCSLVKITPWAWSDPMLIPLLTMIFYYNHRLLNKSINHKLYIFLYPILLFLCVFVKYSSIFFIFAHFIFGLFLTLKKEKNSLIYFKVSIISLLLSALYLLYNFVSTGFITGKRFECIIEPLRVLYSFCQILFVFNPFINIGTEYRHFTFELYTLVSICAISSLLCLFFFLKIIYNYLRTNNNKNLLILCLTNSIVFLMGTIYSYFTTKIDALDYRLLLGYYLFFFFAVIIALPYSIRRNHILLIIGILCSISNLLGLIFNN